VTPPPQDKKVQNLGIGIMLAVVLLLGMRSLQTVNTVLSDSHPIDEPAVVHKKLVGDDLKGVTQRDSLIAIATLDASVRDPFGPAAVEPKPRKRSRAPRPVAARVVEPLLAALIFDDINPTVQITVGKKRSDWLRAGDLFQGWQVAEIDARSVRVKKGDKEIVLH